METNENLNLICANCGIALGHHSAGDDDLPRGCCPSQPTSGLYALTGTTFRATLAKPYDYTLIWSVEHRGWWKEDSCGYTKDINQAGLYSRSKAMKIMCDANKHTGIVNEVVVEVPNPASLAADG